MEKAVDGAGEFVTKNKRPVTFSFSEFKLDELKASMLGLEDGRYATLSAHVFDDDAMLRSLVVGVSKDMRQVVLDLELQRTAMGVQLNPQFPQVFLRETFDPLLEEKIGQLKELLGIASSVDVVVDSTNFNISVQGDIERGHAGVRHLIGIQINKSYTGHHLSFQFTVDGDMENIELIVITIFDSIEDLIIRLQETKLDIKKKMSNVTIPVKSNISQPLPPAIQGR